MTQETSDNKANIAEHPIYRLLERRLRQSGAEVLDLSAHQFDEIVGAAESYDAETGIARFTGLGASVRRVEVV